MLDDDHHIGERHAFARGQFSGQLQDDGSRVGDGQQGRGRALDGRIGNPIGGQKLDEGAAISEPLSGLLDAFFPKRRGGLEPNDRAFERFLRIPEAGARIRQRPKRIFRSEAEEDSISDVDALHADGDNGGSRTRAARHGTSTMR